MWWKQSVQRAIDTGAEGTAAVASSQYSCCKRFTETMSREWSWDVLQCSSDMSLGLQHILSQRGLSDPQESSISCPPAVTLMAEMAVAEECHVFHTRMRTEYAHQQEHKHQCRVNRSTALMKVH